MKKILIYNGQLDMGGIERVLISYLNILSKEKEVEVTLLIKENKPEKNIFYEEIPKNIKVLFITSIEEMEYREKIKLQKKSSIFYRIFYQIYLPYKRFTMNRWLRKYFKINIFDYVIDFDMGLGKHLDVIPYKVIGWSHYTLSLSKGNRKKRVHKKLQKYEKIVLICDEMEKELELIYPDQKNKGVRIYNPIDLEEIYNRAVQIDILQNKEKDLLDNNYMVAVSRLVKGKGREDLIDIYFGLKKRGIKEKLYILGDGSEKMYLSNKIKELKLENDIYLLGQKENPYIWMKNAKMFLHTSYGEGLPTVLIESMNCETLVIAYDCPTGVKEILNNGKCGVLIKMGDKKSFEDAVYKLLKDNNSVLNYSEKMKEKINQFSYSKITEQIKEILEIN
ncbi:MAG: glycosyltransferase [Fusobacteriaceae bacterium]